MPFIYVRKDSPYYWLSIYDKNEDSGNKDKRLSTKIPVTKVDRNKYERWKRQGSDPVKRPRYYGNDRTKELLQRLTAANVERDILSKTGVRLKKGIKLSEGLREFLAVHPEYAQKTIDSKEAAVNYMIKASGDKEIYKYSEKDYAALLELFKKKGFPQSSMNKHTAHLSPIWKYFVKKKYAAENIITVIPPQKGKPNPIGEKELQKILQYYNAKKDNNFHYNLIYFLLMTGMRISTALKLRVEHLDWDMKLINAINVKRRGQRFYFPIHPELEKHLKSMDIPEEGRIFHQWKEDSHPKFFERDMDRLFRRNAISQRYTLHNLRDTFASIMANKGIDRMIVKELLDHSSVSTTTDYYTKVEAATYRHQFKKVKFRKR